MSFSRNYSALEKKMVTEVVQDELPNHVAFIMDGNGRWAQKKKLSRSEGHKQGIESLREAVALSSDLGIQAVTFFAFSTENWKRPYEEVEFLLNLPEMYLDRELPDLISNNVKVTVMGDPYKLPENSLFSIQKALAETKLNTGLCLNLAINYGGRWEIIQAVKSLAEQLMRGEVKPEEIDENVFHDHLQSAHTQDPDLVIRTSGEKRISNFLLWQTAYSEFYFTPVFWPDFNRTHLLEAIMEYQRRKRRFGGLNLL